MMWDTYSEKVLKHFRSPTHRGKLEHADIEGEGANYSCGDHLFFGLKLAGERVEQARYDGEGCSISLASADILSELIEGKKVEQILEFSHGDLLGELGEVVQTRLRCAVLPLETVQKMLKDAR